MSTALYESVIFGPVRSRRLGLSLGVNLLPLHDKLCSFDCIYCECGWGKPGAKPRFNSRETVRRLLREKLTEMVAAGTPPDVITFAGNGEPTMHPEFGGVIDDTIAVRDELVSVGQDFGTEQRDDDRPRDRSRGVAESGQQHTETRLGLRRNGPPRRSSERSVLSPANGRSDETLRRQTDRADDVPARARSKGGR